MDPGIKFLLMLAGVALLILIVGFRKVPPEKSATIVTLGKPGRNIGPGLTWIIPLFQEVRAIDRRIMDLNPTIEDVLTKDGVPTKWDLRYLRQVTNPRSAQFNVANPDRAILGLVQGMLVDIVDQYTSNQLTERPEIKDEIATALDQEVRDIEDAFGVNVSQFRIEKFRLPLELEIARTDVRVATQERIAAKTRARMEAEVTQIERAAQDPYWVQKTFADTLAEGFRALAETLKGGRS